jgi:4-hydroxy-tetrahydrodipicolinate synthase
MVYKSNRRETLHHYRKVATATALPIMVYNNPVSYGVDITVDMFGELADLANIVAIKESSEDTRRLTELRRAHGDRYVLFGGVDDIVLESLMLGATGWVSGLTNAFPRESVALFALAKAGRYTEALAIYRWFMPLLRLDTIPTLVQCIKLAEQLMGRGSEMVRAPRLCLTGEERTWVETLVRDALATRPSLP